MKNKIKSLLGVIFVIAAALIVCSCTQITVPSELLVV
jgi:hypothetical protein